MKTIKVIKEDIAVLLRELGDMRSLCISENRDPCESEQESASEKLGKVDDLEKLLALEVRTQATLDRTKEPETPPDKTPIDTRKDKKKQEKRDSFASHGEFYQAIMIAGTPGGVTDPRLSTRDISVSGMSEGVPSDGGFLVGTEQSNEILKPVWDSGMILPMIDKVTLSGNKNAMTFNGLDETSRVNGSRAGGIVVYSAAEAESKTKSKPKFRKIELKLNKLIGLCYATDELLEDANALAQTINTGFRDEFDFKITDWIINGTGAGEALGILNSGCVVTVDKEAGQDADTIIYENVSNMWSRLMAKSRPKAIWIINQDCEPQLNQMSIAVGTGGIPVFMPAGGTSISPYSTLFGRPVVPVEHAQTVGTTGDIMLCDFSQYKAIDKGGLKADISMHVRYIYDEQVFRFVYRFDGEPMLGSAIEPYKGSNTLSHFIKLESR